MIDLLAAPIEHAPEWALDPSRTIIALVRRGVLYTGVHVRALDHLLRAATLERVRAAMGPCLFFGRTDGPFVPYDAKFVDQNTRTKVEDRAWPWCFGDLLHAEGTWSAQPFLVRYDLREGEVASASLYLAAPAQGTALRLALAAWVESEFGGRVWDVGVDAAKFLDAMT